jgi:surface-anchored protein
MPLTPRPAVKAPTLRAERLEDRTVPYGSVLTTGSADVLVSYTGGNWSLAVQNETTGNTTLPANDVLLGVVSDKAVATRPAGSQWDFLGVAAGKSFWRLPETPDSNLLSLGVDTTGVPAGTFKAYTPADPRVTSKAAWVKLGLVDLRGPGELSVYQTVGGNPKVWVSTADNGLVRYSEANDNTAVREDAVYLQPGQEPNFTWAFSKPGHYRATFQASAVSVDVNGDGVFDPTAGDQMSVSPPVTYDFFAPDSLPDVPQFLIDEHVDLGMDYRVNPSGATGWEVTAEDGDAAPGPGGQVVQYPGDEVGLFVGPPTLRPRPAGAEYDFLGTPAGQNLWQLEQDQQPNILYQGVATEETDPAPFLTYFNNDIPGDASVQAEGQWIRITLRDVIGPAGGKFSLWQEGDGNVVVHMASADGIDSTDRTYLQVGGHVHYNWGFTKRGVYKIGLEASTILDANGDGLSWDDANGNDRLDAGETVFDPVSSSGIRYFYFAVDTPNAAPVNAAPASVNATVNQPLAFVGANGISVSDPDPHPNPFEVRLTVTNGTVNLGSLAGLTVTGGANGAATVTVRGKLAALNAALATLTYTPTAGFAGTATLTVFTNDRGFFYPDNSIPSSPDADDLSDNFLTDTDTVAINVRPGVEGVVVNAGAAQRSRVTSLTVTFTGEVTLAAGAFTLAGVDLDGNPISVGTVNVSTAVVGGKTVATLTFAGIGTEFGSLSDGRWNLTVVAANVTAGGQAMAGNFVTPSSGAGRITRLFGDTDGDGDVDGFDFVRMRAALNTTVGQPGYRADLDRTGNGTIDGFDLADFRQRLNRSIP